VAASSIVGNVVGRGCMGTDGADIDGADWVAVSDVDRAAALSRQLAQAHSTLRDQLQDLRSDLGSRATHEHDLRAHCVALCSALTAHHAGEDTGMFAELLRVRPDLEPVVGNLVQDHQMIAGILVSVRRLASEAAEAGPERRETIRRELDGLAAIMESHFRYEERAISAALDSGAVRNTGWGAAVFRLKP
jgi:hypothetical protein